jgi:hypothetical protein
MKANKVFLAILCTLLTSSISAQKNADGIYTWDMSEFLKISKGSFQLYLYQTEPMIYGLDRGDTILSEGRVEYESDDFIKLTSKNYELETEKSMTVLESKDTCIKDSLKFNFTFPFDGHFKIILYLEKENEYSNSVKHEFSDRKEIVVSKQIEGRFKFHFTILNQTPQKHLFRNYLKVCHFRGYPQINDTDSNTFEISIPDLTNSYFNRRLINCEYAKISTCTGGLKCILWNGEDYSKIEL